MSSINSKLSNVKIIKLSVQHPLTALQVGQVVFLLEGNRSGLVALWRKDRILCGFLVRDSAE